MKHVWNTFAALLIIALVAGSATDTNAGTQDYRKVLAKGNAGKSTFTVTAQYMGSLEGRIHVGGRQVYVPRNTPIFVVGKGVQEDGYFVNEQFVYVSGVKKRGQSVATMIVVRPVESDNGRRTRNANPLVGESADDVPE
jgi:hypothetical protein